MASFDRNQVADISRNARPTSSESATWSLWKRKREDLGPGLFLYLGTRRGIRLYAEHRFVNLVWGIEAFHRKRHIPSSDNPLNKKIDRILDQISKKKDKNWLSKKLETAHEPSLGERIFEAVSLVPLGLDEKKLRTFSDRCAQLRNDISHFGGQRHPARPYDEFAIELSDKSNALAILYQMMLLHEIGIDEKILKWWIFKGYRSHPNKMHLFRAALLDRSDVDHQ